MLITYLEVWSQVMGKTKTNSALSAGLGNGWQRPGEEEDILRILSFLLNISFGGSHRLSLLCAMVTSVFSQTLHMLFLCGSEFAVRNWEITLYNVPKWKVQQILNEKRWPSRRKYVMTKHLKIYFGYCSYFSFFPDYCFSHCLHSQDHRGVFEKHIFPGSHQSH